MRTLIAMMIGIGMTMTVTVSAAERPVTAADAKAIFERFARLEGTWKSHSTKGWTEVDTYELAAKGSVVLNRSFFEGEPNDGMLTTWYLDGDRLLLTHYCEAGNQPTLVASTIDDETGRVTFRFLRGTNMRSRDVGHMDSVVLRFVDDDHLWSRWSWYQNGEERWLEDIEQVRD